MVFEPLLFGPKFTTSIFGPLVLNVNQSGTLMWVEGYAFRLSGLNPFVVLALRRSIDRASRLRFDASPTGEVQLISRRTLLELVPIDLRYAVKKIAAVFDSVVAPSSSEEQV